MTLADDLTAWAAGEGYTPETHAYGPHPDQVADLTVPVERDREPGAWPVAVLLHGGFWRTGFDRHLMDALAASLSHDGYATWNVEYRRGPGTGGSGETVSDVIAAIAALAHVPEPLDLRRVLVIGHSAGGHLALLSAPRLPAALVVSLAGVTDLHAATEQNLGSGAAIEWMSAMPEQEPDAYAAADPIRLLPSGVRTLLVHGDRDDRVPIAFSRAYRAAAPQAAENCTLVELAGEDHFGIIDPRSQAFAAYRTQLRV